jgi:glycosyltransferase involved in cell wall biosynthesis
VCQVDSGEGKLQGKIIGRIKHRLRGYRPYILAREVRRSVKNGLSEVDKLDRRVISLKPAKPSQGNVLLSYINDPFFLKPGQPVSNVHQNHWESLQMARTFLDLGYCVDAIHWLNRGFTPQKDYAFLVDVRVNLERLAPLLDKDCVKIYHIDSAHWLFHGTAQYRRLLALQQRKGVTLPQMKIVRPNWAIEHADCATIIGNQFTADTYRYANKPMYRVRSSVLALYPWPADKDFEACRGHFLWLGSKGLVHKGLDLVLDAFAEMPAYHLTVCGPVQEEKSFERAFHRELYDTPNIHTIGWVDVTSREFTEITNNCVGIIYPSCSEGGGASVVTCMHAGLIPIVSYESSVDVEDFGVVLKDSSIEEIKDSIRRVSSLPVQELGVLARQAWEFARANHTREVFAGDYRRVISEIVATYRK